MKRLRSENESGIISIRVFYGGESGQSRFALNGALDRIRAEHGKKVLIEIYNTDQIKDKPEAPKTEKDLIDWLIGEGAYEPIDEGTRVIHLIAGHLHQGLNPLKWDMKVLMEEYQRLKGHLGYTGGRLDPVFLQDKIR